MHTSSDLISTQNFSPLNFTTPSTFETLTTNKSYTPISTCVLEHILVNANLCSLERLYYLLADSLSLIRHNKGKNRDITLSAKQWANKLNCSVAEIFAMQQGLEEKGYFEIARGRNKEGKNMKNVITPTLPDSVFEVLADTPNKFNIDIPSASNLTSHNYIPTLEGKRAYLDRTKMFIKLNYDLLSHITLCQHIAKFSKIVWVDFFSIRYKYYLKYGHCDKNTTNPNDLEVNASYSFTTTYQELQDKFSCSKSKISKTLNELENAGFLIKEQFFVKNDDEEDNLHDKSIWRITLILPRDIQQQLITTKNRAQPAEKSIISNNDPYVYDSPQYINKYSLSNIKNLDSEKKFFKNSNNSLPKTSSELSVSYKNSFEKEKDNNSSHIPCQPKAIDVELSDNSHLEKNKSHCDKTLEVTVAQPPNYQTETNKTTTLINTASCYNHNVIRKMEIEIDKDSCRKIVKFSPNSRLKDWYPLLPEDVGKLNSKAGREFSNNFVNELLLKLDNKYPDRIFPTKNHALSYMAKALQQELHQAPLVNHETFRFTRNDQEFIAQKKREKYLSEVEASTDTSYESQLKRKIAATLEPKIAYQLLTQANFTTTVQQKRSSNNYLDDQLNDQYLDTKPTATTVRQEQNALLNSLGNQQTDIIQNNLNHSFTVKLTQDIQLPHSQQQILKKAITAIYGNVDITYQQAQGKLKKSDKSPSRQEYEIYLDELNPNSVWYQIRIQLIEQFGKNVDRAWFSKLNAKENLQTKTLTLLAPTNFIRDYINNKYGYIIKQFAQELGLQFVEIFIV